MPRQYITTPPDIRFWKYVNKTDFCWLWTASYRSKGYGQFARRHGDIILAHRFSWILHRGPIPDGLFVLHRCDNPPCVNPDHLWLGTQADNLRDMAQKGRSTSGDRNPSRLYPERRARGERHGMAKLSARQVRAIRAAYVGRVTHRDLGIRYGVSASTIGLILTNKKWTHL